MTMLRSYPGSDHVTGLRAYAALFVVMTHTGAFSKLGLPLANFNGDGRYGVAMFFIISGFSVTASLVSSATLSEYFTRRLMRIWPLYAGAVSLAYMLYFTGLLSKGGWMIKFGSDFDLYNYLMHVSFLSFLDYRIANSVLGVEWSIPIEIVWYFIIPLIWMQFNKGWQLVAGALILLVAGFILGRVYLAFDIFDGRFVAEWVPIKNGAFFLLGMLAYKWRAADILGNWRHVHLIAPVAFAVMLVSMLFRLGEQFMPVCTMLMIAFYRDGTPVIQRLLAGRLVIFLGTISYSIYLLHTFVLALIAKWLDPVIPHTGVLGFAIVVPVTVLAATLSYVAIERPTNRAGRWLAQHLRSVTAVQSQPV